MTEREDSYYETMKKLKLDRIRAEINKFEAETRQASEPLWKKPGFYGAITPILLAIIGLLISWQQGWFDTQDKLLRVERTNLEYDIRRFTEQKEELENHNLLLQVRQEEMEARYRKDSLALVSEKRSLIQNLNRERHQIQSEISELRSESEMEKVALHIDALLDPTVINNLKHGSIGVLLRSMAPGGNNRRDVVEIITDRYVKSNHEWEKVIMAYLLHRSEVSSSWIDSIMVNIDRSRGQNHRTNIVFASGDWTSEEILEAVHQVIFLVASDGKSTNYAVMKILEHLPSVENFRQLMDPQLYITLIALLRDTAINGLAHEKYSSLQLLSILEPLIYYAVIAQIVVNETTDSNVLVSIGSMLGQIQRFERIPRYRVLYETGNKYDIPSSVESTSWQPWIDAQDSILIEFLTKPVAILLDDKDEALRFASSNVLFRE